MTQNQNKIEKQAELEKYRDLVLATIDYYLDNKELHFDSENFDSVEHFKNLKNQTIQIYGQGKLKQLKQWFRDFSEMHIETGNLKFKKYLQEKTKYRIDIFDLYLGRIDKIIEKGKITTENQFYDINLLVDKISQDDSIDKDKIEKLNKLLREYEENKSRKKKKPTA